MEDGPNGPDFLPDLPEPAVPPQQATGGPITLEDTDDEPAPVPEGKLPVPHDEAQKE